MEDKVVRMKDLLQGITIPDQAPMFFQIPFYLEQAILITKMLSYVRGPKKRKRLKLHKKHLLKYGKSLDDDIKSLFGC